MYGTFQGTWLLQLMSHGAISAVQQINTEPSKNTFNSCFLHRIQNYVDQTQTVQNYLRN